MSSLYNVEYEWNIIASVLQYPDVYTQIEFLNKNDFSKNNGLLWEFIRQAVHNKQVPTPAVIAERAKSIGITFDGIDPYELTSSLLNKPIDKKGIATIAKALKKKSFVRKIYENAGKLQKEILEADKEDKSGGEMLSLTDKYLGESLLNLNSDDDDAINLDEGIPDLIEERGNNPQETVGYKIPFKLFENYYGGLTKGDVFFLAARTGAGKSTFLMNLLDRVVNECNPDLDIKGLYLDSEMDENKQRLRLVAARLGVPYYLINSGNWRKDSVWFPKVRAEMERMRKNPKNNLFFKQVHKLSTKDLETYIRNWYYRNVGRDGDAFIILDYLKPLAVDMMKGNTPEWQVVYSKMQTIKDIALDLKVPIFTAIQLGVSATTKNKSMGEIDDSEAAYSMSKRLDWLVSFSGILRKKLPDEIAYHGPEFGTHMIIPHKHREEGSISTGHHNLVKIMENKKIKYVDNFLCYDIDNFKVDEKCDFRQIAERNGWTKFKIPEKTENNKEFF